MRPPVGFLAAVIFCWAVCAGPASAKEPADSKTAAGQAAAFDKAAALAKDGQWDAAKQVYLDVLRQSPDSVQAYHQLGYVYLQQDELEKSIEAFEKAVALRPESTPNTRYLLATALVRFGELDKAEAQYLKAVQIDRRLMPAYHDLGVLYFRKQEWAKAIEALNEALKLKPDSANTLFVLGLSHLRDGRPEKAIEQVLQLRKLPNETKAVALENLIRTVQAAQRPAGPDASVLNPGLTPHGAQKPVPAKEEAHAPGTGRMSITGKAQINLKGTSPEKKETH